MQSAKSRAQSEEEVARRQLAVASRQSAVASRQLPIGNCQSPVGKKCKFLTFHSSIFQLFPGSIFHFSILPFPPR